MLKKKKQTVEKRHTVFRGTNIFKITKSSEAMQAKIQQNLYKALKKKVMSTYPLNSMPTKLPFKNGVKKKTTVIKLVVLASDKHTYRSMDQR